MATKKTIKSIRLDANLNNKIVTFAAASGLKESEAIRLLLERGLACESLSVFATPVGQLIRDVIEAEFALLSTNLESFEESLEERIAKVTSRGTKASLHTAMLLTDVSRAIIPAWRETPAAELWQEYSRAGGELQAGRSYPDVKAGLMK